MALGRERSVSIMCHIILVSPESKEQACLQPIIKDVVSQSLGFPSCNATHCVGWWHWTLCVALWGLGLSNRYKVVIVWMLLFGNKLPFVLTQDSYDFHH